MITCVAFDADDLVAALADASPDVSPERATIAEAVEGVVVAPRHQRMMTLSFRDLEHLHAFIDATEVRNRSDVTITEDHVVRGSDWLVRRWDRGPVLKHVALAKRADGLTLAEMLDAWRNHGGHVQSPGEQAVTIPERVRGLAYVQHHPRVEGDHEWPYDAITEVWFDDLDALRDRADWFAYGPGAAQQKLFKQSWFLALRETALL